MTWIARVIAAAVALAICPPAAACNKEGFELPWDLANADRVVVARTSNFRIVPNEAQGQRLKQAIEAGTATSWQKKQYEEDLSKGIPPGGTFGLFDVTVREVLKGKASRRFTVIFPDTKLCCFAGEEPSVLPTSMPDRDAIIGLRQNRARNDYFGLKLPILYVDSCVGPMLFSAKANSDNRLLHEARKYFGSKRRD